MFNLPRKHLLRGGGGHLNLAAIKMELLAVGSVHWNF